MKTYLRVILVVWLAAQGSIASAEMTLRLYDETKHDRFYVGDDKAFIGDPHDWSGVGRGTYWATMISPSFFLSANHWHQDSGSLYFYKYETNDPTEVPQEHEYQIATGQQIADTDLWLGKLSAPQTDVATYPILFKSDFESDYDNMEIYTFGLSDKTPTRRNVRLGRNNIDLVQDDPPWISEFVYDDPGLGADESYLQSGDSGAPSFVIFDGSPALVGIHWGIDEDPDIDYSYDTFVPAYITEINAAMATLNGGSLDEQVTVVPEPATLVMLLGLGVGCLVWSVWRRASRPAGR